MQQASNISQKHSPLLSREQFSHLTDHLGGFIICYLCLIFTILMGIILLIAILDPILSYLGLDSIAKPIFFSMRVLCAQTPSHSFYIFGHQCCLCARCSAIYGSFTLFGSFFVLTKKKIPALPWWGWVLFSLPMACDGITQMFGWRESTWELRLITGALFGFSTFWFVLPRLQKALEMDMAS